jgi:hypothetical protein
MAGLKHGHRRLVSMKHRVAENLVLQGIDQRLQLHPAHAQRCTMLALMPWARATPATDAPGWRHSCAIRVLISVL